jgi:hypothetical protein
MLYGIRRRKYAIAVSYLQPPRGFRKGEREFVSDWVERGDVLRRRGDGDLEWNDNPRECWYGVEGRELDCCWLRGGRGGRFVSNAGVSVGECHAMFDGECDVVGVALGL